MYNFIKNKKIIDLPKCLDVQICKKFAEKYGIQSNNVYDIDNYSDNKKNIIAAYLKLMFKENRVNYKGKEWIYTIYYLPMNLFKIWIPLIDLSYRRGVIRECIKVLDIGCGPGTSTFGLLEFYKNIALEDKTHNYSIKIDVIEREEGFLEIFKLLFNNYIQNLPINLEVVADNFYCKEVKNDFEYLKDSEYDLIFASNVFNSNEKYEDAYFYQCCKNLRQKLKNNSSMIFIEPGQLTISNRFKSICNKVEEDEILSIFSPCCSLYNLKHKRCIKFCVANTFEIKANSIDLLSRMLPDLNYPKNHSFDYVVFRNDTLRKYSLTKKKRTMLGSIDWNNIGSKVNIIAIVLACITKDNGDIALIICDGTIREKVWINITKEEKISHNLDEGMLRGEEIDIKNVNIHGQYKLNLSEDSQVEVLF